MRKKRIKIESIVVNCIYTYVRVSELTSFPCYRLVSYIGDE